jgi:hypothetical protein
VELGSLVVIDPIYDLRFMNVQYNLQHSGLWIGAFNIMMSCTTYRTFRNSNRTQDRIDTTVLTASIISSSGSSIIPPVAATATTRTIILCKVLVIFLDQLILRRQASALSAPPSYSTVQYSITAELERPRTLGAIGYYCQFVSPVDPHPWPHTSHVNFLCHHSTVMPRWGP